MKNLETLSTEELRGVNGGALDGSLITKLPFPIVVTMPIYTLPEQLAL